MEAFDPTFDFRTDATGPDPDSSSPTLRAYHQMLWSKPLPDGTLFILEADDRYLRHSSERGVFLLSSDTAVATWSTWQSMAHVIRQIDPAQVADFDTITYQMGAMIVWPRNTVDPEIGTINQARGRLRSQIGDRLDLTVECVRRYYDQPGNEWVNPLWPALNAYRDFFDLFEDFRGFTSFFLLQDMLTADGSAVECFLPCDDFSRDARPQTVQEYFEYRVKALDFVKARNQRMIDALNTS